MHLSETCLVIVWDDYLDNHIIMVNCWYYYKWAYLVDYRGCLIYPSPAICKCAPFVLQNGCFEIFRYEPFATWCCLPIILSPSQNHWLVISVQKRKKYKPIQKYISTYIYIYIIYYICCFRIQFQNIFFILIIQPPHVNNIQLYTLIYSVLSSEGTSACRLHVVFTYYYVGLGNVYWTFRFRGGEHSYGFQNFMSSWRLS